MLANMRRMISFYSEQRVGFAAWLQQKGQPRTKEAVEDYIDRDSTKISWTRGLKEDLRKDKHASFDADRAVPSMYRPFCKQWLYLDRQFNEMVLLIPRFFPTPEHENLVISLNAADARKTFGALITNVVPNLALSDPGQCFPLYYYEPVKPDANLFSGSDQKGYRRQDAIKDSVLTKYLKRYGSDVTKLDIFYYVYGMLHSADYKSSFAADLKKMIPRIPMVDDFWSFSHAGRELATLHLNYERVDPWPLQEQVKGVGQDLNVTKMRFPKSGGTTDRTTIIYNSSLTLSGIPLEAYEYDVNGKSAIEWIMDRYQVKKDKATGIVNNPNEWSAEVGDPRYIVDLVRRLVTVSIQSVKTVSSLPPLTD